tara:strand:+ start:873 stop:2417 length:1545 start_codon:yes stop_codon:yes gene_type:complete
MKELSLIFSFKEVFDSTLNVIGSGDKFNAMTEALSALLKFINVGENCTIHLVYSDDGLSSDLSFHNFKLPLKVDNDRLNLSLGSDTSGIEHFETSDIPFAEVSETTKQKYPSFVLRNGIFYFFVWNQGVLIAAAEIQGADCELVNSELAEVIAAVSQCLSFSLQNLDNDFKLLILKKQLEKQKQEIIEDKQTIERQNQILRSLMEAMTGLNKADLEDVFNYCLGKLKDLFPDMGFGLIVDGEREGIVRWACFLGISDYDQEFALDAYSKCNKSDSLELFSCDKSENDGQLMWNILPMTGQQKRVIGRLLIRGYQLQKESKAIVSLFLEQLSAYTENKLLMGELERIANTDGLTGTFNRYYFSKELERIIQNAQRFQKLYFSIFLIDLNGLKRINDDYGHQQGDKLIIKAGELLMRLCRKSDIVCRFGGDEYVVLCPSTNLEQASRLMDRIRGEECQSFLKCEDSQGDAELVPIAMSIGVCSSSEGIDPDKVLETADQRMYQNKKDYYESNNRYR